MENKEKKQITKDDILSIVLSIVTILYFFYGFYFNENSAGAGPYDFELIWSNLQLFKEGIFVNLDNYNYNDSRTPLPYIIHALLNPFTENKLNFRYSVLIISLLVPILFFFSIKKKYLHVNNSLILLLTSILTLSPYFRTTSYWGLGENYGLIFLLSSYLIFSWIKKQDLNRINIKNSLLILSMCLFSSLCVYFDQKLVFVPILCLYLIYSIKANLYLKLSTVIYYIIFSLPLLYLIFLWENILPPSAASSRSVGQKLFLYHLGYCLTIIAFYVAPLLLISKSKFFNFKINFFSRKLLYVGILFLFYIIIILLFENFSTLPMLGKGIVHKLLALIIENSSMRLSFTLIAFFLSAIIVFEYFKNKIDIAFVFYFLILAIVTYPFQQEYLDPLIFLLAFTFFNTKLIINYKNTYFIFVYFLTFSIISKIYYNLTIV